MPNISSVNSINKTKGVQGTSSSASTSKTSSCPNVTNKTDENDLTEFNEEVNETQKSKNESTGDKEYNDFLKKQEQIEEQIEELEDTKRRLYNNLGMAQDSEAMSKIQSSIDQINTSINNLQSSLIENISNYLLQKAINESEEALQSAMNTGNGDFQNMSSSETYASSGSGVARNDVVAFAKQFEGKSQSQMRGIMQGAGYQFDNGAWCADFVNFVTGQTTGKGKRPSWYENCSNKAYCPTIEEAGKRAGAQVSASKAKAGDLVLFDWNGGVSDHIGIFIKDNGDGTITTIEGNTSGSMCATRVRSYSNISSILSM